jgi:hypothetical protein
VGDASAHRTYENNKKCSRKKEVFLAGESKEKLGPDLSGTALVAGGVRGYKASGLRVLGSVSPCYE